MWSTSLLWHNSSMLPVQIWTDTDWLTMSLTANNWYALKTNGTLRTRWTNNGTPTNSTTPIELLPGSKWKSIAQSPGWGFMLMIKDDWTLRSTGRNDSGFWNWVLWDWTTVNKYNSIVQVWTDNNWKQVAAWMSTSFWVKNDGTLWAWWVDVSWTAYWNGSSYDNSLVPIQIWNNTNDWSFISAWTLTDKFFIKNDWTVWISWNNENGQLGNWNTNKIYVTEQIPGWKADYVEIENRLIR